MVTVVHPIVYQQIVEEVSDRGFSVVDHFLAESEVLRLADAIRIGFERGEFRQAGIGHDRDYRIENSVRGDFIRWIGPRDPLRDEHQFFWKLDVLAANLDRAFSLGIDHVETLLALYPRGSRYVRHSDQFRDDRRRKISVSCYLNPGWSEEDGGHLILYLPYGTDGESSRAILPEGGRLVCFDSRIEHEVVPARRDRYSATGWLLTADGAEGNGGRPHVGGSAETLR